MRAGDTTWPPLCLNHKVLVYMQTWSLYVGQGAVCLGGTGASFSRVGLGDRPPKGLDPKILPGTKPRISMCVTALPLSSVV